MFGKSLFLTTALCVAALAQDPNLHIYLAYGQSNMSGQATVTDADRQTNPRFQVLRAGNHSGQTVSEFTRRHPRWGIANPRSALSTFSVAK